MNLVTGPQTAKMIKKHRLAKDMSQNQLARLVGSTQHTVSSVERCAVGVRAKQLPKFAKALDIDMQKLQRAAMSDFKAELTKYI